MNFEINKIHNVDFLELAENMPAKCANLIIADPPYFEVKGDFDFIWPNFEAYLQDVETWAKACKRLLADNGSLYWWGMDRKIAYSQVILDRLFVLLNSIVWERPGLSSEWDTRRTFIDRGMERILFYANQDDESDAFRGEATGWERVMDQHIKPIHPMALYLKSEFERANVTAKEISKLFPSKTGGLTGCVSNWLNGDNFITETQYGIVREYLSGDFLRREYEDLRKEYEDLRKEYEDLGKEYEDLRKEYESLRRPFFNHRKLSDVWRFSQTSHITSQHDHPTQKPETICKAIIETSSRPGDLVIIPFSGSGTEATMAIKLGRNFYASEIDKKHCDAGNLRVSKAKAGIIPRTQEELEATGAQPSLFDLS